MSVSTFDRATTPIISNTPTLYLFIILTPRYRDMVNKMVFLTCFAVITIVCTFVFNVSPVPTQPEYRLSPGIIADNLDSDQVSRVYDVKSSPEVDTQSFSLNRHQRILQFSDTKKNAEKEISQPSIIQTESEMVHPGNQDSRFIGSLTNIIEDEQDSKIVQMNAHPDKQLSDDAPDQGSQNSHIPSNSASSIVNSLNSLAEFDTVHNENINFVGEKKLPIQNEIINDEIISKENTSKRHHKKSRNASYRNTTEVPTQRLPQAIIIGVKKSGTRALLEFLRIHPDVEGSGPEPHFFDRNYHKGLDWYRSLMPKTYDGQITIEKTPSYFITQEAPQRMLQMNPDIKLILVVRDPVTRAISDYCQAASKRRSIPSFEELAMVDERRGVVNTTWGAIRLGLYYKHMEKWLDTFKRKQIHLVDMHKLITEPAKELAEVERFLHLSPYITDGHFYLNGFKGSFPCMVRQWGKVHCLDGSSKGREHPNVRKSVVNRLGRYFAPFNDKFYEMVGRNFEWPTK